MDQSVYAEWSPAELEQIMNVMKRDQSLQRSEERRLM